MRLLLVTLALLTFALQARAEGVDVTNRIATSCERRWKKNPEKQSQCRREQTSAATEYIDIRTNIINDPVKTSFMQACLGRTPLEEQSDWPKVIACFKRQVEAKNVSDRIAVEEEIKRKAELDKRAEEQRKRDDEEKRAAEFKRAEEQRIAAAKLDAEVADISKSEGCVRPSDAEIETIRDHFELDLFDARSARFHSACKYSRAEAQTNVTYICGLINSKNAMGAYVGYHPFFASIETPGSKGIVTDKKEDALLSIDLTFHCSFCTTYNRSYNACNEAIKRGKYDPMMDARMRADFPQ